ncbi:MAG TPA: hypothetical protein EYN96_01130 [Candidatus Hydrogenedentes bacterium]|nr:hypothetical protein [Candidatus Hydrogenedentota bacterium]
MNQNNEESRPSLSGNEAFLIGIIPGLINVAFYVGLLLLMAAEVVDPVLGVVFMFESFVYIGYAGMLFVPVYAGIGTRKWIQLNPDVTGGHPFRTWIAISSMISSYNFIFCAFGFVASLKICLLIVEAMIR